MIEVNDMQTREQDRCIGGLSSLMLFCINFMLISLQAIFIMHRRIVILHRVDTFDLTLPPTTDFFVNTLSAVPYIIYFLSAYALITFLEFRVRNERITGRHQLIVMVGIVVLVFLFILIVPVPEIPAEGATP